ncbi:amidohydrolase family protein [Mycobacterium sp. ACS4331]|uniref:amidohydrolase family protein n=1 Tax=Mycobacterium sp. ACS4331 TaxID=1834121 RepID=UPI0007FE9EDD|nr:amidohydrolase family protein [Mycobacterium sp. ACS4331]OBF11306.1 amidohydrolase [Mycobacterium sp. ACS4331]
MPLQDSHQIISVDDHLVEHPRVWLDRLPARWRDDAPQIREVGSAQLWHYNDTRFATIGLNAVAGKPRADWGVDPVRYEDMIPGCYDPALRVKDMDVDGVQAALCFPSFPGFAGSTFFHGRDKELARLCIQAWNDFYIDEWCATAPDRYIPLGILPFWDIEATVAEAQRLLDKGARTLSFPDTMSVFELPSFHTDHWDPLWQLCSDADLPVSLHFGAGGYVPGFSFSGAPFAPKTMKSKAAPFAVAIAVFATNSWWTTVDLLFSGKLQQFPNLKFSLAEGGIGWVPYMLERTDFTWERHRYYQDIDFDARPSELFHQHFWTCFIDDEHGVESRHKIGVDRIMLESDFPHSDSNWPNCRKRAAEVLSAVPDEEVVRIAEANARELLHFPRTA